MSLVSALWLWLDLMAYRKHKPEQSPPIQLDTPISLKKVLSFGLLFVFIEICGTLITRAFGRYGMLATGFFGGLASSASTTAAAATMASHGQLGASVAGSVAILSSLASAIINLPIIWRTVKDKEIVRRVTLEQISIVFSGLVVIILDQWLSLSDRLLQLFNYA
jgi:uncharacterized membrane protein (DUF4010 family)